MLLAITFICRGPTGLEASGIVYSIILALHILLIACTHEKGLYAPYRTKIVLFLRVVLDGISTIYLGDWVASVMAGASRPAGPSYAGGCVLDEGGV